MINYLSFDIEDWFQVENFKSCISRTDWDTSSLRVIENTELILRILETYNTKATFFVLGWIAKKCPQLIKKINDAGHEIASHGYWHELIYNQTKEKFREDVQSSKKILEDLINKQVVGYRAPSFSVTKKSFWAIDILIESGYKYDSSIFPVSLHSRYGFKGVNSKIIELKEHFLEVPITTFDLFGLRLPFGAGGAYFRLLPYSCFKALFRALNDKNESFVFYLHPWELDVLQPRVNASFFYKFRHYTNIKNTEAKLRRVLCDFKFQPIGKITDEYGKNNKL
jgi:polysaccharide deacetylase family protein (PEP-CTERM system associated)